MNLFKLFQHILIIGLFLWTNRITPQDPDCPFLDDYNGRIGNAIPSVTFQNIEDQGIYELLLKKIKPNTKIVMFGEQHWMSEISQFKNKAIALLVVERGFTNVVIEIPYSYTGFINAFIQKNPGEGDDILKLMSPNFNTKEDVSFITELQAWNYSNPQKKIRVLCSDFEQDFTFPFLRVLLPYFKEYGDSTVYNHVARTGDIDAVLLEKSKKVLNLIPSDFKLKSYEFVDKAYVENVLMNIEKSFEARQKLKDAGEEKGFQAFMEIRMSQIQSNLKDSKVFGTLIKNEKTIFWGGATHFNYSTDKKQPYDNEGSYLRDTYKGKTVSFNIATLGYSVPKTYYDQRPKTDLASFNSLVDVFLDCNPQFSEKKDLILESLDTAEIWLFNNMESQSKSCVFFDGKRNEVFIMEQNPDLKKYQEFDYHIILKNAVLFEHIN